MRRTLSPDGERFIKEREALRLHPYQDDAGVWTIGWGHTRGVTQNSAPISEKEAEALFWEDIANPEKLVNEVTIELEQHEFDALVSFVFNEGERRWKESTLRQLLNNGDRRGAVKQFDRWIYYHDSKGVPRISKGLVKRRAFEKAFFLTGQPPLTV